MKYHLEKVGYNGYREHYRSFRTYKQLQMFYVSCRSTDRTDGLSFFVMFAEWRGERYLLGAQEYYSKSNNVVKNRNMSRMVCGKKKPS